MSGDKFKYKNNSLLCHSTLSLFYIDNIFFFFSCCILDCVCASLQPVRRHQSSEQMAEGRLGRGGVTKLGSGPSGFHPALFLLSGDTCVVTGAAVRELHYGLSGDGLLWL